MEEWMHMLRAAKEWAHEAGEKQLERLESPMKMDSKSSAIDLVTEMDVWTEQFLMDKIQTHFPGHVMRTEESGFYEGSSEYEWVIDPIDGTVNYAKGLPFFCISIGIRCQGETVAGIIHAPKLSETYEAVKGKGAFLNGRSIHVSETSRLEKAVLGTGFPYDKGNDTDNNLSHVNQLVPQIGGLRRLGSAALDLAQVACGRLDGYWELKLKVWDVEAGLLLLNEAGGKTMVKEEDKGLYVAGANAELFSALTKYIQR
ncbi:myo-inositol-1(or 4)-monophosphatase [Alteribacillus persepolensis]|uniref:Inositol-1-monophosphatase n=1 Tax=Alteribacillus persepolensis TaxID=568899 RepID=A0A1G8G783_9BACI|nr:inositol monophosphatase family protein [Alteribacillus persepolensis]SDH90247.1 myo-inositol-1(or 4)-monophosphatase [Alteribacillus persepolensis]